MYRKHNSFTKTHQNKKEDGEKTPRRPKKEPVPTPQERTAAKKAARASGTLEAAEKAAKAARAAEREAANARYQKKLEEAIAAKEARRARKAKKAAALARRQALVDAQIQRDTELANAAADIQAARVFAGTTKWQLLHCELAARFAHQQIAVSHTAAPAVQLPAPEAIVDSPDPENRDTNTNAAERLVLVDGRVFWEGSLVTTMPNIDHVLPNGRCWNLPKAKPVPTEQFKWMGMAVEPPPKRKRAAANRLAWQEFMSSCLPRDRPANPQPCRVHRLGVLTCAAPRTDSMTNRIVLSTDTAARVFSVDEFLAWLEEHPNAKLREQAPVGPDGLAGSYYVSATGVGGARKPHKAGKAPKHKAPVAHKRKALPKGKPVSHKAKGKLKMSKKTIESVPTQHRAYGSDVLVHGAIEHIDSREAKFSVEVTQFSIGTVPGSIIYSSRMCPQELAARVATAQGPMNAFTSGVMTYSKFAMHKLWAELDLSGIPQLSGGELAIIVSEVRLDSLVPDQLVRYVNMRRVQHPPMVYPLPIRAKKHRIALPHIKGARPLRARNEAELDAASVCFFYLILMQPCHSAPVATADATTVTAVAIPQAGILTFSGEVALLGKALPVELAEVTAHTATVGVQRSYGASIREPAGQRSVAPLGGLVPNSVLPAVARTSPSFVMTVGTGDGVMSATTDAIITVVEVAAGILAPEALPVVCLICEGFAMLVDWYESGTSAEATQKRGRQYAAATNREASQRLDVLDGPNFAQINLESTKPSQPPTQFPPLLRNSATGMITQFQAGTGNILTLGNALADMVSRGFTPWLIEHNYNGIGSNTNAPIPEELQLTFYTDSAGALIKLEESPTSGQATMPPNYYVTNRAYPRVAVQFTDTVRSARVHGFAIGGDSGMLIPVALSDDGEDLNTVSMSAQELRDVMVSLGMTATQKPVSQYTTSVGAVAFSYAWSVQGIVNMELMGSVSQSFSPENTGALPATLGSVPFDRALVDGSVVAACLSGEYWVGTRTWSGQSFAYLSNPYYTASLGVFLQTWHMGEGDTGVPSPIASSCVRQYGLDGTVFTSETNEWTIWRPEVSAYITHAPPFEIVETFAASAAASSSHQPDFLPAPRLAARVVVNTTATPPPAPAEQLSKETKSFTSFPDLPDA